MKKLVRIMVSLLAIVTLAGCTTSNQAASEAEKTTSSTVKTEKKEVVLYVTRHGKTMFNTVHRAQGWSDTPLTEEGIEVAEQLGKGLKKENIHFASVYSSDAGRARETAEVVLAASGQDKLELHEDKRLRESCFGIYEGDTDDNMWGPVAKNLGYASLEEWRASDKFSVEEGLNELAKIDSSKQAESFGEVRKRMQAALKDIAEETAADGGGNVLVVAHGISILSMISDMTEDVPSNGAIPNASVTKITYKDGKFSVNSVASTAFLEAGEK